MLGVDEDLERTPESVIRHKIHCTDEHSDDESEYSQEYEEMEGHDLGEEVEAASEADTENTENAENTRDTPSIVEPPRRSPSPIPDDAATIRAPGGKLRTRPSATPADMAAMAAQRRQVSGDHTNAARMATETSSDEESSGEEDNEEEDEDEMGGSDPGVDLKGKAPMRKSSRKSLKMPTLDELNIDLNLDDIGEEFDRVIETQKRGYLMRHSTRVIHASSREIDEEEPRFHTHKRTQSWQVEPWRASGRRRSTRNSFGQSPGPKQDGPAPPLPGQSDLSAPAQNTTPETAAMADDKKAASPENGERGRLFVKVIGVKDLTLPLPQREPTWFCLTLDNGLHCVTTSWLELAKNAPIGQEFEL